MPWGTTMKDYVEAAKWWRKAADQGNAEAQYKMSIFTGSEERTVWLKKAAAQNYGPAEEEIGSMYWKGHNNVPLAIEWYNRAATHGDGEAMFALSQMYTYPEDGHKDFDKGFKFLRKAAELGNKSAQNLLAGFYARVKGNPYIQGEGVKEDYIQAYMWTSVVLQEDGSDFEDNKYLNEIIPKMTSEQIVEAKRLAVNFILKSEKQKYPLSSLHDLPSHLSEVERLFLRALQGDVKTFGEVRSLAEKGDMEAQLLLGGVYRQSLSHYPIVWYVPEDDSEALKWFDMAADQGSAQAQVLIASVYWFEALNHRGTDLAVADVSKSMKWLRKAADQGYPDAEEKLGSYYKYGNQVPQSFTEAEKMGSFGSKKRKFCGAIRIMPYR